jgi:hypothetical protein
MELSTRREQAGLSLRASTLQVYNNVFVVIRRYGPTFAGVFLYLFYFN